MESFVQMPLKTYDVLKFNNEHLRRELKKEQESHSEDVAEANEKIDDLAEKIEQYKRYILERNCQMLDVENFTLGYYLDIDSWTYGINYKDELLKLGFTKQEMDEFIVDKYEEYGDKSEPKEAIEHDGCMGCAYEDFEEFEEPCVNCKGTQRYDTMAYLKAKDCYVRKVDKRKE